MAFYKTTKIKRFKDSSAIKKYCDNDKNYVHGSVLLKLEDQKIKRRFFISLLWW